MRWCSRSVLFSLFAIFSLILVGCSAETTDTKANAAPANQETPVQSQKTTQATASDAPTPMATESAETDGEVMRDGSQEKPLRLLTMAGEGGATDKVLARIQPVLDFITKDTGLHFDVKFADSYAGTLEAMAARHADVAQLAGPFVYLKARERGVAELLAVGVRKGESTYYGGIFVRKASGIKTLKDLKGRSCAFGDFNSMSSFNYPCGMLFQAGVDPSRDLKAVYLTDSHAKVLAALAAGKVDAGCCSLGSFEAAARENRLNPEEFVLIAKSDAIPGTPLVMYPKLAPEVKAKLKQGYANLEKHPEILESLRGDDGRPLDKYDTTVTDADYDKVAQFLRPVNDDFKARMLAKAGKSQ